MLWVDECLKQIAIHFLEIAEGAALRFIRSSYADYFFHYNGEPGLLSEVSLDAAGLR